MPVAYTDVDRLILERWEDTKGLLEAYEDLQHRIHEALADVDVPLERWAAARGYKSYAEPKNASFSIYRPSWVNRRRQEALVYFAVEECAPIGYRRVKAAHPGVWLYTNGLQATKMKEADRVRFTSELRARLGAVAEEWRHADARETEYPFGKELLEVNDLDRVRLVAEPEALFAFVTGAFEHALPLADAVEQTLTQFR